MRRGLVWVLLVVSGAIGSSVRADAPPLPRTLNWPGWTYAKIANDADGKPLLVRYNADKRMVQETKTVTKLVKEVRVLDGQTVTLEIPKTETVPANATIWQWKASVASLEDPRVRFLDVQGKAMDVATARERLAKTSIVRWANEPPDPHYLQTTKPDTVVIVAPPEAFASLPGPAKEPLPTRGADNAFEALARISTDAAGKRQLEFLMADAKAVKTAEGTKTVLKWSHCQLPCDHPSLRLIDTKGKTIDLRTARLDAWTPILYADAKEDPHPVVRDGVRPETLLLSLTGPALYDTVRDYEATPGQAQAQPRPQPTPPQITALPMPPLPQLPPVIATPKPQPTPQPPLPLDPRPAPVGEPQPTTDPIPADGPPIPVIKKQLEVQWGPLGRTTRHDYDFKSIRFGPPLKEVVTVNGQGNFTGKIRFPVRVLCDITVRFNDGTSRMETKHQTFHFFRDSFGEWSFRFIENN